MVQCSIFREENIINQQAATSQPFHMYGLLFDIVLKGKILKVFELYHCWINSMPLGYGGSS